jgi:ribosome-associated toxin RatA of RatAB toxin-antitoxin module
MRSFHLAAAVLGLAASAPALPAPGPTSVSVQKAADSRGVHVDIRGVVESPIGAVEQVIGDTNRYADWMPNVTRARAIPPDGFETTVHLPWPLHDVTERVKMQRTASRSTVDLAWRQIRGDLLRDDGRWTLIPRGPRKTEVRYQANFQLKSWIPMFLIKMAQRNQGPKLIANLRDQAAARARID